jgi:hypothetical protein
MRNANNCALTAQSTVEQKKSSSHVIENGSHSERSEESFAFAFAFAFAFCLLPSAFCLLPFVLAF